MKRKLSKGNISNHNINSTKHYIKKTKGRANSTEEYTNKILSNAYINRRNERMQIRDFSFNSFVTNIKKKVVDQPGIKVITKIFNPDFPNKEHFLAHLSTTTKQQPITCDNVNGALLRNNNNNNNNKIEGYYACNNNVNVNDNKVNEVIDYHTHRILQALSFTKSKREYDKIYIRNKYARLFME